METLGPEELKKIPISQNLDDAEVSEILELSERQNYAKGMPYSSKMKKQKGYLL